MSERDHWTVEKKTWAGWTADTDGPHVWYGSEEKALAYARRLMLVFPQVRLRHTMTTIHPLTAEK